MIEPTYGTALHEFIGAYDTRRALYLELYANATRRQRGNMAKWLTNLNLYHRIWQRNENTTADVRKQAILAIMYIAADKPASMMMVIAGDHSAYHAIRRYRQDLPPVDPVSELVQAACRTGVMEVISIARTLQCDEWPTHPVRAVEEVLAIDQLCKLVLEDMTPYPVPLWDDFFLAVGDKNQTAAHNLDLNWEFLIELMRAWRSFKPSAEIVYGF